MKIVSYNVLADCYVKPEMFPLVRPEHLDRGYRRRLLIERLVGYAADVICLQEVEEEVFGELQTRLTGYQGVLARKGGGKPDGCATFVRGRSASHQPRPYSDGTGHVALVTLLEDVAVVNTHFKWGSATSRVGLDQAVELLDGLDSGVDWIVCGDFNAAPDSALVAEFHRRGFADAYASIGGDTCNSNSTPKRIDYFMHRGLRSMPLPLPAIDGRTPLPSETEPSDHLAIRATFARV